jgi:hypothetical protein
MDMQAGALADISAAGNPWDFDPVVQHNPDLIPQVFAVTSGRLSDFMWQ